MHVVKSTVVSLTLDLFFYSFNKVLLGDLLCARHCARLQKYREKYQMVSDHMVPTVYHGRQTCTLCIIM